MKFFLDTEFIERGPAYPIKLISIGLVSETGRTFYGVSNEWSKDECGDWVKENVVPHVMLRDPICSTVFGLGTHVKEFVSSFGSKRPSFWAYFGDYDWVVFCQMFGTMMDMPKNWPHYCNDVKQLSVSLGDPKLPEQDSTEHHALNDAEWCRSAYKFLTQLEG